MELKLAELIDWFYSQHATVIVFLVGLTVGSMAVATGLFAGLGGVVLFGVVALLVAFSAWEKMHKPPEDPYQDYIENREK